MIIAYEKMQFSSSKRYSNLWRTNMNNKINNIYLIIRKKFIVIQVHITREVNK